MPRPLRWLAPLVAVYVVVLAALPAQMALRPDALVETITRETPELDRVQLDFAVFWATVGAGVVHGVVAVATIWLTVKLRRGRRWARVALTGCLLLAMLSSVGSAAVGGEFLVYAVLGDILQVAILLCLWAPSSVRRFFADHRDLKAGR